MSQTILIDPVTRIEGHAKVTIQLADDGSVADARLHITQLRGFEKFCEIFDSIVDHESGLAWREVVALRWTH